MKKYLCIDVDAHAFRYGVVSDELEILDNGRIAVAIDKKEDLYGPLVNLCMQYKGSVEGISITMPGVIDRFHGMAYSGGVFSWVKKTPIAKEIEKMTGMPVAVVNDAKAVAMAEIGYGSLKGIHNGMIVMIFGGGIGGAVVVNNQILEGHHFAGGEFSYIRADYRDRDGLQNGMFARTNGIDGLIRHCVEETGNPHMNIIRIMMKVQEGDEAMIRAVQKYCDELATYIYNIQCVLDCERIVIGGNFTNDPAIMRMIQEAITRRFENVPVRNIFEPEVVGTDFQSNARMYGAVYNFKTTKEKGE